VIAEAQAMAAEGLRRAAHLLRHQRHLDRQQGHLPDAARARREADPRPQLPQERAPRRGALGRAPGLPRLGAQQKVRPVRPGAEETSAAANQESIPDAQALILTSCTYDGLRYDLAPIVEAAHARGIKVIVDEAWYGFARFHPEFRPDALEAGADYATQSTHKVLSAFSQASMIHVNDPAFREHLFRENFNMHTSTSPQYGLIASLDVARKQAVMEGFKLLSRTLELGTEVRKLINSTKVFRVLELEDLLPEQVKHDGIRLDPTKVTIDISGCGYTVDDLQKLLFERYNIQTEKSTFNTLTLLLTIGTTRSKVSRLYDALMRIARENRAPRRLVQTPEIPAFTKLVYLPRDAYYCGGELLPVLDERERVNRALAGRICADQIVPYPPGIPVLVPGQLITRNVAEYVADLLRSQKRMEMHGIVHEGYQPCIRVLKPEEVKGLTRLG
jgi:arginine decarboxylase